MNAVLLYKPGEITPEGDPIIVHFGPGCSIAPHERAADTKTIINQCGQKFTVRGEWKEISREAGYGDLIDDFERDEKKRKKGDTKKKPAGDEKSADSNKSEAQGSPFDTGEPAAIDSI